jgi:hypothetical protein
MARRMFPSRLELKRPEGSSNAAPLANVILTAFLYVSPVQTMPAWEKVGVRLFHVPLLFSQLVSPLAGDLNRCRLQAPP